MNFLFMAFITNLATEYSVIIIIALITLAESLRGPNEYS